MNSKYCYYTAHLAVNGDACNNGLMIKHEDLTTRSGLVRRVKDLFNITGVRCKVIDGTGPNGCFYVIIYPKLHGFGFIGQVVSILIQENLNEDYYNA